MLSLAEAGSVLGRLGYRWRASGGPSVEVHKPKPVHGWRELLSEIGVIVLGVLIALGAEQAVEALHWRHQIQLEREALKRDAEEQLGAIVARQSQQACVDRRLGELQAVFRRRQPGAPLKLLGPVGRPQNASAGMDNWRVAVASQVVGHMAFETRAELASAFSNYENLYQLMVDADHSWIELSALDDADALEAQDWAELRRAYIRVRATEDRIKLVIPYVLETQNLGLAPPRVPLAEALVADYSKAFCRPLLAR